VLSDDIKKIKSWEKRIILYLGNCPEFKMPLSYENFKQLVESTEIL